MKHKMSLFRYVILILFFMILMPRNQVAEGYGSFFLYDYSKVPDQVLIDTAGVVSLIDKVKILKTYKLTGEEFIPAESIQLADTLPVSQGGYGGWVQYLVTQFKGDYVKIVVEPYKDQRTWINLEDSELLELVNFENPSKDNKIEQFEINIFLTSDTTALYASPEATTSENILKKSDLKHTVFYPVKFKNGFIQIGKRYFNDKFTGEKSGEDECRICSGDPIGWIKARDPKGKISFFLYVYAWD